MLLVDIKNCATSQYDFLSRNACLDVLLHGEKCGTASDEYAHPDTIPNGLYPIWTYQKGYTRRPFGGERWGTDVPLASRRRPTNRECDKSDTPDVCSAWRNEHTHICLVCRIG